MLGCCSDVRGSLMKTTDDIQSTNAGNGDTHTSPATPRPADSTSRQPGGTPTLALAAEDDQNGRVARSTAAAWMTLLIAVPVVVAFLTVWGGLANTSRPDELSVAALKLFAVWCLSFLPGWLYVRFLGLRAGALWDEYVLYLHRLGWDRPAHLPKPPRNSDCYQEWLDDGGERQQKEQNIYRQKFAAYYGRSIPDPANATSDFSVRTENMFPVFLATIVLAVCWVAVLWNTSSATNPEGIWDVLKFAFLGAYAFIVQSLIRRFFQSDLRPSAYASVVLRIIVVLVTMAALHQLLGAVTPATEAAIAFMVGFFPVIAFQALQRAAAATLRVFVPQMTPDYPLNQLDGLNVWYEARLVEEGIEDMQNLATANLVDVILHTGCRWEGWSTGLTRPSSTCTSTGPSAATTSDGSSGRPKSQQSTTIARLPPTGSHQRATVRTRRPRRRPITGRLPAIRRHPHRATCTPMIHLSMGR